ncbi:MAG: pyrimidine 5'-nucleotidase [Alphaproteobacteria bacterium]|nr:pyrimidine 5'-nucleotidase [Alphaproteobacteria bacterium]
MTNKFTPQPPFHETDYWVFDLDNTLYPAACDLFSQIDVKMGAFISQHLGIDRIDARKLQKRYYHEHGTTLAGLMANDGIHPDVFLDFVHDIDVTPIPPSPDLRDALRQLPGQRLVYTNGSVKHAENVMDRLGITDLFDGIYDIIAAGYRPKPDPEPYRDFVQKFDVQPQRAVMVEDIARNLEPAHAMGMSTVLIRTARYDGSPEEDDHIHHVADDLLDWLQGILDGDNAP